MKHAIAGLLGFAAVAVAAPASAQSPIPSGTYALDPTHATLTFSVDHIGLAPYFMRFERFDIDLTLDVDDLSNSSVSATIDPTSISTPLQDGGDFNNDISGPQFLDSAAFPTIEFVSTSVEQTSDTTATVRGDLTMRGVTRPVTMQVELTGAIESHPFQGAPAIGFVATGALDRSDFGSTYMLQTVSNGASIAGPTVEFTITAEFYHVE